MKSKFTLLRSMLTFFLAITYLGNLFVQSQWMDRLDLAILVVIILMSFTVVTGSSKIIGYCTFIISISLFFLCRAPLSEWEAALRENLDMVIMFILIPLVGIPIQYGGYFSALQSVFRRYIKTNSRFYLLVSSAAAFLGVLINLAVVPLVYQISKASTISSNKKLLSSAMSRGFATVTIWAPTTAAIALIMRLCGAEWPAFFPYGLTCGVIAGVVGSMLTNHEEKKRVSNIENETTESVSKEELHKVIELGAFGIALVVFITLISHFAKIPTILVVSLASVLYPMVWMGLIGKFSLYLRQFRAEYFRETLPRVKNEVVLFMGAGFFVNSITYADLGDYIPRFLSWVVGSNTFLLTVVVIFASLIISGVGVHPIIPVMIIGGTVRPEAFGVTPVYLSLLLSISWSMGVTISPTSATVIATSSLTGESPFQIGIRWNSLYVLITTLCIIAFLTIVHGLGLI